METCTEGDLVQQDGRASYFNGLDKDVDTDACHNDEDMDLEMERHQRQVEEILERTARSFQGRSRISPDLYTYEGKAGGINVICICFHR